MLVLLAESLEPDDLLVPGAFSTSLFFLLQAAAIMLRVTNMVATKKVFVFMCFLPCFPVIVHRAFGIT